ncbi:MAG: hypothetical protein LBU51_00420 [Bacteroidales bacterium]|jgi:hypothetical protein|nr:hypothetical protein [Bacteroidales bacterium]
MRNNRFRARYYDSDLSIWLSVDPMSDKYPYLSPYAYVANNPVKLVDPNGMDIWTISEDGTINRQKDKKIDRIDVIDKDGNTIKGTEAKYGTIKQHTANFNKDTKNDFFDINNDDLATETYANIADNTSIEWSHAKIGTKNSDRNIIGTSHRKGSDATISFLFSTNYTLKEVTHNHPSGSPFPSFPDERGGHDIGVSEMLQSKFPNIKQNIYVNGKIGIQKESILMIILDHFGVLLFLLNKKVMKSFFLFLLCVSMQFLTFSQDKPILSFQVYTTNNKEFENILNDFIEHERQYFYYDSTTIFRLFFVNNLDESTTIHIISGDNKIKIFPDLCVDQDKTKSFILKINKHFWYLILQGENIDSTLVSNINEYFHYLPIKNKRIMQNDCPIYDDMYIQTSWTFTYKQGVFYEIGKVPRNYGKIENEQLLDEK